MAGTIETMLPQARAEASGAVCRSAGRRPRLDHRRSDARAADPVQPGRQRHQVHGPRLRPHQHGQPARDRWNCAGERDRNRQRHRHGRDDAGAPVRAVHAGRQLDHTPFRRHRARPLDRAPAGATHGWRRERRERAGRAAAASRWRCGCLAVNRLPSPDGGRPTRASSKPMPRQSGARLLVVDDHPVNLEVIAAPARTARLVGRPRQMTEPAALARWRRPDMPSYCSICICRRWTALAWRRPSGREEAEQGLPAPG